MTAPHNFTLVQGPAAVLVDQLEALARGVFEVERELLDFFLRRLGLHLALGRAVGQLVRQRDLDGLLPALLWTGEPRNASTLSRPRRRRRLLRHQHAIAASKAPQSFRLDAPLALIDVAVAVRIHLLERRLEARRHQQVLEVRVAAVDEELDDALVALDGA